MKSSSISRLSKPKASGQKRSIGSRKSRLSIDGYAAELNTTPTGSAKKSLPAAGNTKRRSDRSRMKTKTALEMSQLKVYTQGTLDGIVESWRVYARSIQKELQASISLWQAIAGIASGVVLMETLLILWLDGII